MQHIKDALQANNEYTLVLPEVTYNLKLKGRAIVAFAFIANVNVFNYLTLFDDFNTPSFERGSWEFNFPVIGVATTAENITVDIKHIAKFAAGFEDSGTISIMGQAWYEHHFHIPAKSHPGLYEQVSELRSWILHSTSDMMRYMVVYNKSPILIHTTRGNEEP